MSSLNFLTFAEFTNPYGIRSTTPGSSKASSEGLTQFGTARDYHDFDMQNDLFWYDEKDDGSFMTPSFRGPDLFGCPSEDKFIMSLETDKQSENPLDLNHKSEVFQSEIKVDYLDKTCLFDVAPVVHESEIPLIDYYQFDTKNKLEAGLEVDTAVCSHYGCSVPLSDCCTGAGEFYGENPANYNHLRMKETHSNDFLGKLVEDIPHTDIDIIPHKSIDKSFNYSANRGLTNHWVEGSKGSSGQHFKVTEKDFILNGIYNYGVDNGEKVNEEISALEAAANDDDVPADEILMYDTREDEYEVFDLRIIHRKNRFVGHTLLAKFFIIS